MIAIRSPAALSARFADASSGIWRFRPRSVETYPVYRMRPLPHFVVPTAEEVPAVCGMHIAMHDPASVLADVAAKRALLAEYERADKASQFPDFEGGVAGGLQDAIRLVATAYAGWPGYREEWRP